MAYAIIDGKVRVVSGTSNKIKSPIAATKQSRETSKMSELLRIMEKNGLTQYKPKEKKEGTFKRVMEGLNTFNPTGAAARSLKGEESFFKSYVKDISQRVTTLLTGKKYERVIPSGSDFAEALGFEGKIEKFGVGFAADVLLDPSTYVGGVIVKGAGKVIKGVSKIGIGAAEKIAPKFIGSLRVIKEGAQEALGKAFIKGYKSTPGLQATVTDAGAKVEEAIQEVFKKQTMKTGVLSESQRTSIGKTLIKKRKEVFEAEQKTEKTFIDKFNATFLKDKKFKVTTSKQAQKLIPEIEERAARDTARIQKTINYLQRDITKRETKDLENLIKELRKELFQPSGKTVSTLDTSFKETQDLLQSTVNLRRRELQEIIGELEARLKYGSNVELKSLAPKVTETWAQKIKRLNQKIVEIQNTAVEKTKLLQAIVDARQIARKTVDKLPIIIRRDLNKLEKRVVDNLLKTGKPIPEMFRDLQLEGVMKTEAALGKKTGVDLVRTGKLAEGTPAEVYFPFIAVDPIKMEKMLRGSQRFGVGSEDYLKQFKNQLKEEELVQDVGLAYGTRRAEVVKDMLIEKELRTMVAKFGKQFDSPAAAAAEGFVPITRKGVSTTIGDVIGYVTKYDAELLNAFMGKPEFATIDLIAKRTGFDAVTNLFKRSVTGLFAPFHIRNWVSGLIQNYEVFGAHALNPNMIAGGFKIAKRIVSSKKIIKDEIIKLGGIDYNLPDLIKAIGNRFFGGSVIADLSDASEIIYKSGKVFSKETLKNTFKKFGFSKGGLLGKEGIPFRMARKTGEFIEMQQKASGVITALDQGRSLDEALELARHAGFDYRALTAFESKIMRRIIPFYAFARFNVALQIKTLLKNPERVNNIAKIFRNIGETNTPQEQESLPDYLANGFGIKVGKDINGNPTYMSSFGTPVEAFFDLLNKNPILKVLSNMNPIIKTPVELGIGKDSFRQKDLKDVYNAAEYSGFPQIIKDLLQIEPVEKTKYVNGKPTKETYIQYVANPERLLIARGLFTSRGATYLDQIFDGDLQGLSKALKLTTGLKPVSVNMEYNAYIKERDQERDLEDILLRYDALTEFRTTYEKKQKQKSLLK